MNGKVFATTETRKALAEKFGVQQGTLTYALNFKCDSLLARKIRVYAVNFLKCAVWIDESTIIK